MGRSNRKQRNELRRGWTTGACATAATKAAYHALLTGEFPDPVEIVLPKGERPAFALALHEMGEDWARAGIVKDAGDDPDVTHGATIIARVSIAEGGGVSFSAGEGVGMVTKPGLAIPPGEPAINPVPRSMMSGVVRELAKSHGAPGHVAIEISVPGGAEIAKQTWNGRLGIENGLSILGTTGVVNPFSCSAWIHSIHSGIDVARAAGLAHVVGSTGSTSEKVAQEHFGLPDHAMLDMGDFAGGLLKYLRRHPLPRLTIAGGVGKMTKLAQGLLDLHSSRGEVDFGWLAERAGEAGADPGLADAIRTANTAAEAFDLARAGQVDLPAVISKKAQAAARGVLGDAPVAVDILLVDREGRIVGTSE